MDREQENSLLTGLGLGLGLAGAGAAGFGARSLLKNRAARQRKAAAQSPSGAGGVDMVDLSTMQLPERAKPTRAQAYENAARRPVTNFEFQQYRPSGGSPDPGTVTDVVIGEIYRRGGDDAYYQQNRNLQTTQRVDRGDMPLSTPRSAATPLLPGRAANPLLPGRAPTTGGIDLVDLPPARPDRAQSLVDEYIANAERENRRVDKVKKDIDTLREGKAMGIIDELRNEPRTLVEVQETTEPRVIQNSIESVDTAQDQMAGRVARTVQRDIDENLATFDVVQDSLEQRGATPVEAARTAASVTEGEPVYTQTDRLVDEGRSYLRAQEIDPNFGNQYEAENRAQAAQVRDRISRAKALQDAGNEILEDLKLEGAREQVASDSQAFLRKFNRANPEEVSGTRVVDNARQRRDLGAVTGDVYEQPRVTTESVLTGTEAAPDTTMRGRALRGGKVQGDESISYLDEGGISYASADTGVKARQDQGPKFEEKARLQNQLNRASDQELELLTSNFDPQSSTGDQQKTARMAQDTLRTRAVANMDEGRDLSSEQARSLTRARRSVDASQKALQSSRNQKPTLARGPQQDVARSMETLRRGMVVEPSELPPVIDNVQAMYGEGKGETVAAVGAPTVYTGAAREAAGPVLFTGKSKAESVVAGPRLTGQEIKTATGRAYDAVEPGLMSTTLNVAGTPRNREIAQQVESNAQQFLSDAISGGLTPRTQQTLEVAAPIRARNTPATPATRYPITQSYTPSSVEASQRTGYARYQPGRSEQAPISPFIGEMSGGTRQQSTEVTGPLRGDIGRTSSRPTRMSDRSLEPTVSAAPIGRLTQSPGLPRVGLAEETPFVQEFNTVQGQQRTERGKNIAYPRMMKLATANRPAGRLMTPLTLPNSATGEVQTINLGAGPLRTYRM
jgi:hypothetical protein